MPLQPACILSNPDISGVGVRAATYAQNMFSFAPAIYALLDQRVTQTELDTLETQSTTILITGFAILISTIVQALTRGLSNYHATIILNLSWMNNTNCFIYFLLYIYHKFGGPQQEEKEGSDNGGDKINWVDLMKEARRNRVLIIGSLHLTLMAAVGLWLWSQPASFGRSPECSLSASVVILGRGTPLSSTGLRGWSIFIYSLLLLPGLNLIIPIAFFIGPYIIYVRVRSKSSKRESRITLVPIVIGLAFLALINIIFLADTELAITRNQVLLEDGENLWTFGQTLALLLLLVPLRDLVETISERRPVRLGQKLLDAIRKEQMDVVEYVLDLGANVNMKDKLGRTALMLAAGHGYLGVVKRLIEHGAAVNVRDWHERTALMLATVHGHLDVVKCLLKHGANVDMQGWVKLLLEAAGQGHLNVVKCLLEQHADANAQDFGRTALMNAISHEHLDVVECLLEQGANINAQVLIDATKHENLDMVECLLEYGADVNVQDRLGRTALISAARHGKLDLVKCLCEHDAIVDGQDQQKRTAFIHAAKYGHLNVVKYLLERGANIGMQDQQKRTALMHAAKYKHLDVVRYLEHKASNPSDENWNKSEDVLHVRRKRAKAIYMYHD